MIVKIDREIHNDFFYPLLYDQSRLLFLKGGGGSGKSYEATLKLIHRMLSETNNRFVLVRKVGKTIRNSQFRGLVDAIHNLGLSQFFEIKETEMKIVCPYTNSEIISLGMDDREKAKSLAQPTSFWIEEPTELTPKDYRQIRIRLRGRTENYKQIMGTFNPIDIDHWIHSEMFPEPIENRLADIRSRVSFLRNRTPNDWIEFRLQDVVAKMVRQIKINSGGKIKTLDVTYSLHHSTYEDNRFLSDEDRAELEELKYTDYNYWKIYAKGEWGTIGNLVFNPQPKIVKGFPSHADEIIYGLDFGYTHPASLARVGFIGEKDVYMDELIYVKGLTNAQLIEYVTEHDLMPKTATCFADSASPSYIQEWRDAGFNVEPAIKGNDSVIAGIDIMKYKRLHITDTSINGIREFKSYKWKEDKDGEPIEGEPLRKNDHFIDCVRYPIFAKAKQRVVKIGFIN